MISLHVFLLSAYAPLTLGLEADLYSQLFFLQKVMYFCKNHIAQIHTKFLIK